jgi:hypothetical protein
MDSAKYPVDHDYIYGATSRLESQEVLFDPFQVLSGLFEKMCKVS